MKIRTPQGSVGWATPSVALVIAPPHAVLRPNAAGPLEPASATYEPTGFGPVVVWCRVCAVTASAIAPARIAAPPSAIWRVARTETGRRPDGEGIDGANLCT